MEKIIYDTHMHTPLSRHATGWPVDYAKEAIKKNFKGIIFTDHGTVKQYPWVTDVWTIPERIFKEYFSLIEFTKEYIGDVLDIRLGLEVDFMPNNLDMYFLKGLVSCAPFDCLLGSVHCRKPYVWEKYYKTSNLIDAQKRYYEHMTECALSGLFDTITHPDFVKYAAPYDMWHPEKLEKEVGEFLDAVKKMDICIEVNTSGLCMTPPNLYPDDFILRMAFEKNIPVTVGSDAHSPDRVGENFKVAYKKLLEIGYKEVSYYIKRKRHSYKIENALTFVS